MIPLFIGGTGRSGTSIIKKVVASHPGVAAIPTELRILVDPGGALDLVDALSTNWSPYDGDVALHRFEDLVRAAESTNLVKKAWVRVANRLGISPPRYCDFGVGDHFGRDYYRRRMNELVSHLSFAAERAAWAGSPGWQPQVRLLDTEPARREEVAAALAACFRDLYAHRAGQAGASHFLDDTPYNLLHVARLRTLFPDLRFMHVHRDFRDVVASYRVQAWGGEQFVTIARRIAAIMARWREIKRDLPADCFLEIGLEEAVSDRDAFSRRLTTFAGLEESEALKAHLAELDPVRMHGGRWRRELTTAEQDAIGPILAEALAEFGYET